MADQQLQFNFFQLSEDCLLIQFDDKEDNETRLELKKLLKILEAQLEGVIEITPGLNSVGVIYNPMVIDFQSLKNQISNLTIGLENIEVKSNHWTIPVCYDTQFGIDLELVAKSINLTTDEVIQIHTHSTYEVLMLGFLPGFAYLGNLVETMRIPRKTNPRTHVSPGSIAIAEYMTGIYGVESPGGWNILGRTPIKTFDVVQNPPNFLQQGDTVSFRSISIEEYNSILSQTNNEH
jgi:inhibitor of KinA